MIQRVKSALTPPTFSDPETTRVARILNTILWFIATVLALALLAIPFTDLPLVGTGVVLSIILVMLVALRALHGGQVQAVASILLLFLWVTATGFLAVTGGIINPEAAGLIIVIIMAGLLSGLRTSLAFTGLSLLSALAIYILDVNGLLVTLLPMPPFVALITIVVNVVVIGGLLYLTLSSLDTALKQADAYAHELEAERALLERRVSERTASAETARQEAEAARQEAEVARREAEVERETVQAINALNDALRGEQDVAQLADNTIRYLCRHLDIQSGALFVMDAIHDRLELAGSYARAGDGHLATQFALGEGLVGQAALEKRPITLENIPSGELTVVSALGQHAPRTILILPLVYENQTAGVVELGTLSRFSAAQVDFLQRAASNVAIAFHTAQTRMRVNELLMQTQQQAEELQAQEEELRAINEELLAQTENLQRQGQPRTNANREKDR